MAWNPSPKVAALRDASEKFGWHKVVLIGINDSTGRFEIITYGKTKLLCEDAKKLGDDILRLIESGFFGGI